MHILFVSTVFVSLFQAAIVFIPIEVEPEISEYRRRYDIARHPALVIAKIHLASYI